MISSLKELQHYLKKNNPFAGKYFAWNGKRYFDAFQFIPFMNIDLIVSCDYGYDTRLFEDKITILSMQKEEHKRREWHHITEETFQGEFGKRVKDYILGLNQEIHLLTYHSSENIEEFIERSRGRVKLLTAPIVLKDYLDAKTTLPPDLPKIGVEPLPGAVNTFKELRFDDMVKKFGSPLVVQWGIGDAGSGTFIIHSKVGFNALRTENYNTPVKITKYMDGYSIAICAVVYRNQVVLSQPNIQIVGCPECVTKSTSYCGTDFTISKEFSPKRMARIYDYTWKVGNWMRDKGYRGLFGIDFVTPRDNEDNVYICEVNARFTGEGQFYADYQKMANQVPLQFFHLAEYLNIDIPQKEIEAYNESLTPLIGSCITLHNTLGRDCRVEREMRPGVYCLRDNRLTYLRPGLVLSECRDEEEFVISCAVPLMGDVIESDASILRIQTFKSVFDIKTKGFNDWANNLTGLVRRELALEVV